MIRISLYLSLSRVPNNETRPIVINYPPPVQAKMLRSRHALSNHNPQGIIFSSSGTNGL